MISGGEALSILCQEFCSALSVHDVPCGLAISTVFTDGSGDPLELFLVEADGGLRLEDDGGFITGLIAMDFAIDDGSLRAKVLDDILAEQSAYWDRETYEIRSETFSDAEFGGVSLKFINALLKARSVLLLTRENVKSTFKEDAIAAITARFGGKAEFELDAPPRSDLSEFPCDLVVSPKDGSARIGAVYFVTSGDKLSEALMLQYELESRKTSGFRVFAMMEDSGHKLVSQKKFQRAQNRSLAMPMFRGDETGAVDMIGRELGLSLH